MKVSRKVALPGYRGTCGSFGPSEMGISWKTYGRQKADVGWSKRPGVEQSEAPAKVGGGGCELVRSTNCGGR